jgi:ABC-type transporter Mla subunit MlaD
MPAGQSQESPPANPLPSGRWGTFLIVAVGLVALVGFPLLKIRFGPSLRLKTCFHDVSGLRPGAKVRVAGVDVGRVQYVHAQPLDKACPAAVAMELRTPYELKIRNDSVASTASEGVLGETFLEIDVSGASGPPIQDGGQLPSRESERFTPATLERTLKELLKQRSDADKNDKKEPPTETAHDTTAK